MKRGNDQPADGAAREQLFIVSGEEMNRIVTRLTIIHTYVQLLRRRIDQGTMAAPDGLEEALATMEATTSSMAFELRTIMSATSHPGVDDA